MKHLHLKIHGQVQGVFFRQKTRQKAQELISELIKQPKGQYISATYSGEPNIGKTKK